MPDCDEYASTNTLTLTESRRAHAHGRARRAPSSRTATCHINSGMEDGLQDALDLLEEVATSAALSTPAERGSPGKPPRWSAYAGRGPP